MHLAVLCLTVTVLYSCCSTIVRCTVEERYNCEVTVYHVLVCTCANSAQCAVNSNCSISAVQNYRAATRTPYTCITFDAETSYQTCYYVYNSITFHYTITEGGSSA
jgi:hypothetical protein